MIRYAGMLRSNASWAKVGRCLLGALIDRGYDVSVDETDGDRFDPAFALDQRLTSRLGGNASEALELTFENPDDYPRVFRGEQRFGLLVSEATRWPPEWVSGAQLLTMAIIPTRFCAEALVASGFPAGRVAVVPHGIDPAIYHPHGERSGGRLRVLFVGTPATRKGLDLLLDAWELAFTPRDPVELFVKSVAYADIARRRYLIPDVDERIASLRARGYRVESTTTSLSEHELADLYRSADVVCQPFRGEGFCMPLLESMACGTPVISTDWGGPLDFLGDAALRIPVRRLRRAEPMLAGFEDRDFGAMAADPDVADVAAALVTAVGDRRALRERGAAGAREAARWTWDAVARSLLEVMTGVTESRV